MAVIFYFSHQPGIGQNELFPWLSGEFKNLLHFPVFGLLGLLIWLGTRALFNHLVTATIITLALVIAYGSFDEWHQSFVEGRTSSFSDVRNDVTGAIIAIACWMLWEKLRPSKVQVDG